MGVPSKIRTIEIKARGLSRHLFAGGYHSAFKGSGMSFSEVRQYQYGDDIRAIDWNVTARTIDPFVKIFEEEREISVLLAVDVSGSAFFEGNAMSKREFVAEICALLAFSADANHDKVGLLLFGSEPVLYLPPSKGREHALRLIKEVMAVAPAPRGTNLNKSIDFMQLALKKRSVCFLISDFWDANYEDKLKSASRKHDCIGIHVWDPIEKNLPDVSLLEIRDPEHENETTWVDTSDPIFREDYTARFEQNIHKHTTIFRKCGADFISLSTKEDYVQALLQLFGARAGKK